MKYSNPIKSIAIGSFDGMHLAHQALIARAEAVAVIERGGGYLTPGYKRTMFTDRPCYFYLFEKIRDLAPEDFVALLQEDFPKLEKIVVGYDFAFGRGKAADAAMLRRLFEGEVEIIDEVKIEGISVHSRTIKAFLKEGNVTKANVLLGRTYRIEGSVIGDRDWVRPRWYPHSISRSPPISSRQKGFMRPERISEESIMIRSVSSGTV